MSEPIAIEPIAYWKLRLCATEHELLQLRVNAQVLKSKSDLEAACEAAGLTVGAPYQLRDDTCSAIPSGPQLVSEP